MATTGLPALAELAPLALLYHENSKINRATLPYLAESIGEFTANVDELRRSTTAVKTYAGGLRVEFSAVHPVARPSQSLERVLRTRRSVRRFGDKPIKLAELVALFRHACGVTGEMEHPDQAEVIQRLRANPSGGALYPVESYLIAFRVEGLEPGVYHYHPVQDCLETVRLGAMAESLAGLVLTATGRLEAPALVVLTARWDASLRKYGERGYRVTLLDAGHLAQNLLLVATALGMGSCSIAGFYDDALAAELGLDPAEEPVVYVVQLGHACSDSH